MNILHVWDSEYPWDVRVEKISRCLTEAGHAVYVAARNRRRNAEVECRSEACVHRLRPFLALPESLDAALQFPAFFNPRWERLIRRVSEERSCDAILVRDLPLAPTAMYVGRKRGIPVILDMAENYPAMLKELWRHRRARPIDYIVRNPGVVQSVERFVLKHIDHIVVVVEESRSRLLSLGVPPHKLTVVRNTPPRGRVSLQERWDTREAVVTPTAPLRLTYLGLMEAPRGIGVLLDGLRILLREGVNCHLDLIGGGRDLGIFRTHADQLGLTDRQVTFHGFVPYEDALKIVGDSDIGVVPHMAGEFWDTTVPNKLFDYMAAALPILTSDAKPSARIVTENRCGVVYRSDQPRAIAEGVRRLLDPSARASAGGAGRAAVLREFNWEVDCARLIGALEQNTAGAGR